MDKSLSGFPRGTRYTPVPNPLFGPLLEAVKDIAEIKCTLRVIWLIHERKGYPRFVTEGELLSDRVLLLGLKGLDVPPTEAICRGIKLGVERGTFISLKVSPPLIPPYQGGTQRGSIPPHQGGKEVSQEELYFLNDEAGRRGAAMVARDSSAIKGAPTREGAVGEPSGPKSNIFTLYEENIGMLTPLLAEEMKEAEESYPWSWIEEAFRVAVGGNKRSWRYIEATLRRWAAEGKGDGESRGHTAKVSLEEYRRRQRPSPDRG